MNEDKIDILETVTKLLNRIVPLTKEVSIISGEFNYIFPYITYDTHFIIPRECLCIDPDCFHQIQATSVNEYSSIKITNSILLYTLTISQLETIAMNLKSSILELI